MPPPEWSGSGPATRSCVTKHLKMTVVLTTIILASPKILWTDWAQLGVPLFPTDFHRGRSGLRPH